MKKDWPYVSLYVILGDNGPVAEFGDIRDAERVAADMAVTLGKKILVHAPSGVVVVATPEGWVQVAY